MVIVVVGDFDEDEMECCICEQFSCLINFEFVCECWIFDVFGYEEMLFSIVQDFEMINISVFVGYKGECLGYEIFEDMWSLFVENFYDGFFIVCFGELVQKGDLLFQFGFVVNLLFG